MNYKELLDVLYKYDDVIIFGYGKAGKILYDSILDLGIKCSISFCDNNSELQGEYGEYTVYSVETAVQRYPNVPIFIATFKYQDQMIEQLNNLHVNKEFIFYKNVWEFMNRIRIEQKRRQSITPWNKIPFEVHLTEHCNLNCASCAHFSTIAQEEYCNLDNYKNDVERLSFLLGGEAGEIHILGGEPLLNSQINDFTKIMRQNFKNAVIGIVTNGILLGNMRQQFWDTCRNYNITLMVTQYPIKVRYEEFLNKAKMENVKYIYFRSTDDKCLMNKYPMDLKGEQEYRESFMNCEMSNKCILLKKGKLYTCSVVGNIEHFNRFFHKELQISEQDYIDIYKAESKEEISKLLATPIPFCRYCNVNKRKFNLDWAISKRKLSEWVEW